MFAIVGTPKLTGGRFFFVEQTIYHRLTNTIFLISDIRLNSPKKTSKNLTFILTRSQNFETRRSHSRMRSDAMFSHQSPVKMTIGNLLNSTSFTELWPVIWAAPSQVAVKIYLSGINIDLVSYGKKFTSLPWDGAWKYWNEYKRAYIVLNVI